jgi:hypothetical protein
MSIRDFYLQLDTEKSSLFVALYRLSRIEDLKSLVAQAAAEPTMGWMYWDTTAPMPPTASLVVAGA